MPIIKVEVEVEIYCACCGKELGLQSFTRRSGQSIDVEPCKDCLEDARQEGRNETLVDKES